MKEAALGAEVRDYEERMGQLESNYFTGFAVVTEDAHARYDQMTENALVSLTNSTLGYNQRIDELSDMATRSFIHHTMAEAELQKELVGAVSSGALKEAALGAEVRDYEERMGQLESTYFSSLCVVTNDAHARYDQMTENALVSLTNSTLGYNQRIDELNDLSTKAFIHHTMAEAELQQQLISAVSSGALTKATLLAEIGNYEERTRALESMWMHSLVHTTSTELKLQNELIMSATSAAAKETALTAELKDFEQRVSELSEMNMMAFVHHTTVEAGLQKELVGAVTEGALEAAALKAELSNFGERMRMLENSYFSSLAVVTEDAHARYDQMTENALVSLTQSTLGYNKIVDELNDMATKQFVHHTEVEAELQKELIQAVSDGALTKTTLTAELNDNAERFRMLENGYFSSLAVVTEDAHARYDQMTENALVSLTQSTLGYNKIVDELNDMAAKQFVHHTEVEAELQKELVQAVSQGALTKATLSTEVRNYEERVSSLETMWMKSFVHSTEAEAGLQNELISSAARAAAKEAALGAELKDFEQRVSELSSSYLSSLATSTNGWHALVDELNMNYTNAFIHSTEVEAGLQNELVAAVSSAALKESVMGAELNNFGERFLALENTYVPHHPIYRIPRPTTNY
jgi:hypothetical protein